MQRGYFAQGPTATRGIPGFQISLLIPASRLFLFQQVPDLLKLMVQQGRKGICSPIHPTAAGHILCGEPLTYPGAPQDPPTLSLSLSTGFSSSGLSMSLGLPYNMTAQLPTQEFCETQVQAR